MSPEGDMIYNSTLRAVSCSSSSIRVHPRRAWNNRKPVTWTSREQAMKQDFFNPQKAFYQIYVPKNNVSSL